MCSGSCMHGFLLSCFLDFSVWRRGTKIEQTQMFGYRMCFHVFLLSPFCRQNKRKHTHNICISMVSGAEGRKANKRR